MIATERPRRNVEAGFGEIMVKKKMTLFPLAFFRIV
ncbi:hypothetical protein HNQ71_005384 [Mesorhizobium sangaii]|uniref:Uncharacterized protein n=1 Tax=Mesorhizobium sangaii TaxID=505389 RepID=A0A841PRJ1_9HYPH|nr:hypothetical protein [Mesorhizobium sangaii]